MKLEVCVDSFKSFLTAKRAGADRIELCSALQLGGLTPSLGLMRQVKAYGDLEVFIMIRPRSGDFLYSEEEFETMKEDVLVARELGFDGIVLGFLDELGGIDLKRTAEMVKLAGPLKLVFHRAFDDAKDPEKALSSLIDLGVIRILSSGGRPRALEGAGNLAELQGKYGDKITIMPGSGIDSSNIEELIQLTGCSHYHMSGRTRLASSMVYRDYVKRMDTAEEELWYEEADFEKISQVRRILNSHR